VIFVISPIEKNSAEEVFLAGTLQIMAKTTKIRTCKI